MTVRKAYSGLFYPGCMRLTLTKLSILIILLILFSEKNLLFSQNLPEYDEIPVYLEIQGLGGNEIDALIRDEELYLPIVSLFDFLRIKNESSADLESISGFFLNPEAAYLISKSENRIKYQGKVYELEASDLIRTESNLYLKSTYFGKVFGLDCIFNFRSLSVTVKSKLELPLIREMRLEEMRRNLSSLKGEVKADTVIKRTYPLFKFGMADWTVTASEEINGRSDARLNLNLGAMVAGGEATASLYFNSSDRFSEKYQYYLWRYVNNDFAPLRQVLAGKIATNAISTLYNPVVGVQLTNTPTTYRRSFGTYTLSDRTEPGWIVELYVNNVLVNYVKADASGFFTFEVPLVYGNSSVRLKFYGPWGEERTREQNISIPYNFLPKNTLEYSVSGGMVEDTLHSRFSRGILNYGLTRNITIGGGAEYLSSITSQPFMPFVTTSFRVTNNLLLSGEYTHGVRAKGTLSYRLPSNIQLDLNYTWYDKEQKAIFYNYREERKATLSVPLKLGKLSTFQRFSVYQIVLPSAKYTTGEWMISGSVLGVSTNLTTYALLLSKVKPYFYSNLSMSFRLPAGFTLMPQLQYGYTENQIYSAKARIEKHLFKSAFINLSYEKNFRNDLQMAEIGFRYDFRFAQTGVSVRRSNETTNFVQYARGSLINDSKTKYLGTDNRTNVGRGGISIVPFLDLNSNRKRDHGEPKVYGLNLHTNSGRVEVSERDTTIRILGLEPYTNCFIQLDESSFENVAWRPQAQSYSIAVDPNILKLVEIPVSVVGEATGNVSVEEEGVKKGMGRIKINFLRSDLRPAGKTLTEDDGYFSYFGLAPGNYLVIPDTVQLNKLGMKSEPEIRRFSITGKTEGDIAEGLDFILLKAAPDTAVITPEEVKKPEALAEKPEELIEKPAAAPEKPAEKIIKTEAAPGKVLVRKDTTYTVIHEITEFVYTTDRDSWAIQIGAFKSRALAERFRRILDKNLGKKVEIMIAGEYYRVRILDLNSRKEVDENIFKLNKLGFKELWIIHLLARDKQILLLTKEDSLARIRATYGERATPVTSQNLSIQVGAFNVESNATALQKKLSALLEKPVTVVPQDDLYKVRITGFTSYEEMMKVIPALDMMGMRDIWIMPVPEAEQIPPERETGLRRAEIPVDSTLRVSEKAKGTMAAESRHEPTIALQVAIYHRQSQALRAKKRIESRLNLPVEIVFQWDYYHVIVTGFFTREETYQYYPELAGIGYPGVTLLMNYKRQK
jgi:cell division protein FtsN